MKKILVSGKLSAGYFVKANYNNQVVLAQHKNPAVPEPFVVWYLDEDGDPHSGSYFSTEEAAQKKFAERAFDWYEVLEENKEKEISIVLEIPVPADTSNPLHLKSRLQKVMRMDCEKMFGSEGIPKTVTLDPIMEGIALSNTK